MTAPTGRVARRARPLYDGNQPAGRLRGRGVRHRSPRGVAAAVADGALLVSNRGRPMMRLVADTVGVHDLICGSCSDEYYRNRLDHHQPHRSCRGNLAEAVAPWGVAPRDIPFSFNVFMRWPVQPD